MPLSPELAFQAAANQAAAVSRQKPAYVSFRVSTHIAIPSLNRTRDLTALTQTRTSDDRSVIVDEPREVRHIETHAFPFAPTFDALSYFAFTYGMNLHRVWFEISSVTPREYSTKPKIDADVTASGLRDYAVHFAADSSAAPGAITHLLMRPFESVRRASAPTAYYFKEVWIDNTTGLPTRVDFDGAQHLGMSFVYGFTNAQWIVQKAHLEQDMIAPLHFGKIHFQADVSFDQVSFPATAPAPELQSPNAPPVISPSPASPPLSVGSPAP